MLLSSHSKLMSSPLSTSALGFLPHQSPLFSTASILAPSSSSSLILSSTTPFTAALCTVAAVSPSSTSLSVSNTDSMGDKPPSTAPSHEERSPRMKAVFYMAAAMALHFGGYEFIRNACLALFTSSEYGFSSPAAFPLANALISPFSVMLLWGYGQQLDTHGPRGALKRTTTLSVLFISVVTAALYACQQFNAPLLVRQLVIALTFLFQSSYQYLLYTQQWSFVSSVLTPEEGSRWFPRMAGLSSLMCTVTGTLVQYMVPTTGLLGLMAATGLTLCGVLHCQDRAYQIAQTHNFDPAKQQAKARAKLQSKDDTSASSSNQASNRFTNATALFRRVPTLSALFCEVLSFQSLNTILNVAFVGALRHTIPDDLARSSYTGRFYSLINAVSALLQFVVLPPIMSRSEPALIWRGMPVIPFAVCLYQSCQATPSMTLLAAAFFLAKTMDYSLRSVVYAMVYQPLDFESRYVGKEIIGVFGSRFGKSGMSLCLSVITKLVGSTSMSVLVNGSTVAAMAWLSSTWWLSTLLPPKAQAQAMVQARQKEEEEEEEEEQSEEISDEKAKDE